MQSPQYAFKASAGPSGVDTGELWYQFTKLAASRTVKHITKTDLITNKVRQRKKVSAEIKNIYKLCWNMRTAVGLLSS